MVRTISTRVKRLRAQSLRRQQLISKRIIPKITVQETKKIIQTTVKKTQPTVNYDAAWKLAEKHFNKGMAGAYLQHMGGETDAFTRAVYSFVKELDKQRRAGNISPTNVKEGILSAIRRNPGLEYQKRLDAVAEYKKTHPSSKFEAVPVISQVDRKSILLDIQRNKIQNVRISGGRIIDTSTGRPINIESVYNKKIVQDVQSNLLRGERLLYDSNYNIKGIESSALQQTIPFTESGMESYNKRILNTAVGKKAAIVGLLTRKVSAKDIFKTKDQKLVGGVKITKSSDPNKVIVTFPNGQKGTINATGRVVVDARLAGKKYTFQDGVLRKINDIDLYEEKLKPVEIAKRNQIFSMQRAKSLSKKWGEDISSTKDSLKSAANRGDSSRLAELQRLGKNRSLSQNLQFNKLQKEVAKNYKLGGELVGKIIGTSLINMGVGSVELLNALKNNPKETLIALPPAIYEGMKEDFNRIMSGDPLEIMSVGLEYWTFGKVGKIAGKIGKAGVKTSYGIGAALSPKYIGMVSKKLIIPPMTLRGVVIKTTTGRAVERAIKKSLKQKGITEKVTAFNKKLKTGKDNINRKLDSISRKASKVKKKTKKITANLESRTNINKQYKRAKQNFKKSMEKKSTITVGNDDYIKAVVFIEGLSSNLAKVSAKKFLNNFKAKGGKIGLGQEEAFIKEIQNYVNKNLNSLSAFKELKNTARLKKSFQINLRKRGKIEAAKITFRKLKIKIEKLTLVKKMNSTIRKITAKGRAVKRGVKRGIKTVEKGIGKVRMGKEKLISNLESRTNLNKQFARARRNVRKSLNGKVRIITIGNSEYIKAVAFIEQFSNNVAMVSAKKFLRDFKSKGGKIGIGQEEQFIKAVQKNFKNTLDNAVSFKKLKEAASLKKPFQIKLVRKNKLVSAKRLARSLVSKVKSTRSVSSMTSIIKKVSRGVRDIKRKVSPKRIKKKVKRRVAVSKQRRFVKKTIRYQMDKARPIRKVSFDKLRKSQKVSDMNKFIDNFFNELGRRQKIDIKAVNFLQMKNVLKKRMRNAINTGNLPEINNFRIAISKLVAEMNKISSKPNIKIRKITGKDRRIRTIKDFESPSPKGTYREVKVGNQVMLQEVKQVQRVKQVMKQPVQKYKVVSIQKKAISLKPLVEFGVKSLSATAIKNILKSKQAVGKVSNQGQLVKVLQDSAQDFKVLQAVGQAITPKVNVASAVASAVNSRVRSKTRLKTKQMLMQKKKPLVRVKFKKEKATRKLSKTVQTYAFAVKKSGKWVRLKSPPMTLADAWSAGSYVLDHELQRSGKLIPVGLNSVVAKLGKNVAGYYGKHQKKFRRARIKKGKVLSLERTLIEKRRFALDQKSELAQIKTAKFKSKRKTSKRKTVKKVIARKKIPTLNQLKSKKSALILKRKRMINKLKE